MLQTISVFVKYFCLKKYPSIRHLHPRVLPTDRATVAMGFLPVASPTMTHSPVSMCLCERKREMAREQGEEGLSESMQLYKEAAVYNITIGIFHVIMRGVKIFLLHYVTTAGQIGLGGSSQSM